MIYISPAAMAEILRLRSKQADSPAAFRLACKPGGCAGLMYVLSFDLPNAEGQDKLMVIDHLPVLIDAQSSTLLDGVTIDYSEDLMGGGFRFENPHAGRTCSCGISYAPKEEP